VIGDQVPEVHVSRAATDQILDALVDNALRHGEGIVRVTARHLRANVVIDVSDDGPGLADDTTVFERRANGASNESSRIGLALARRLAEAEGGRLAVTQSRPHAVFSLLLPEAR
jgi:signal transduction histidine kinase